MQTRFGVHEPFHAAGTDPIMIVNFSNFQQLFQYLVLSFCFAPNLGRLIEAMSPSTRLSTASIHAYVALHRAPGLLDWLRVLRITTCLGSETLQEISKTCFPMIGYQTHAAM